MVQKLFFCLLLSILPVQVAFSSGAEDQKIEMLPITEARNAASGYAMTSAFAVKKMSVRCQALPTPVPEAMASATSKWNERNIDIVESAYFWLLYVKSMLASQNGKDSADAFLATTMADFDAQSDGIVKDRFINDDEKLVCENWIRFISDESLDLNHSTEFGPDMASISSFYKATFKSSSER